jgi:hypothetical protein
MNCITTPVFYLGVDIFNRFLFIGTLCLAQFFLAVSVVILTLQGIAVRASGGCL